MPLDVAATIEKISIDFLNPGTADHVAEELRRELERVSAQMDVAEREHAQRCAEYEQYHGDLNRRRRMIQAALEQEYPVQSDPRPMMDIGGVSAPRP